MFIFLVTERSKLVAQGQVGAVSVSGAVRLSTAARFHFLKAMGAGKRTV